MIIKTDPIAVVCTITANDVESILEDRSEEWCQDFIFENGNDIHDAMVRAASDAIETLRATAPVVDT